ncbi:fungal protein [Schizosaccharomyces japonicus yFS275]|uniref:Fungal protein n=1 Tax=Schizosaccharomyces japonicus (strain yFS275 / FY16936) TaxID=402676 RepID=B6JYA8_SCHJY|nr:fungal protein [Schizosaccharomyces japonicus yFS275]EEB06526.1 fungal protein [Schizosaccharomyces japonicus yFS275]
MFSAKRLWNLSSFFGNGRSARFICKSSKLTHNSVLSYMKYAEETGLSKASTVYQGTLFEYIIQHTLSRHGFQLKRCGGRNDRGIDLLGTWTLKGLVPVINPVAISCKCLNQALGPLYVRELEGSLSARPEGTIGILAGQSSFTDAAIKTLAGSSFAMAACGVVAQDLNSYIYQFLWNEPAAELLGNLRVCQVHNTSNSPPPVTFLRS